jgi:hypothetical protein
LVIVRALFNLPLINKTWLLALAAIFVLGAISLAFAGGSFANKIKHTESSASIQHTIVADTLYLEGLEMPTLDEYYTEDAGEIAFRDKGILMGKDSFFLEVDHINIKQSKSDSVTVKIVKRANGYNKEDARNNMAMIEFNSAINGNSILIPSYFSLAKDQKFRWQEVEVTIWVPQNKVIAFSTPVKEILNEDFLAEADGMFYQFQKGKLTCLDCGFTGNSDE